MKTKRKTYLILILIYTLLVYKQEMGLNLFLLSIFGVAFAYKFSNHNKDWYFWFSASLWLGSGLALFLNHNLMPQFLYFLTAINFLITSQRVKGSFVFNYLNAFFSFFLGILTTFLPSNIIYQTEKIENVNQKNKLTNVFKKIITYSIPFILVIIFFKLYQSANPTFEKYTKFINLDFISWNFVFIYLTLYTLLNGFFFFNKVDDINKLDVAISNEVNPNYTDSFQAKLGLDYELKMGKLIIITLSIILTAFLIIDGLTIFNVIPNELTHAETVHQGIYILIASIVLVILIVSFVFRGQLNFSDTNLLRYATMYWLILNINMAFFNAYKNFSYISDWGLTHKRIGVFVYLILCVIGLTLTIYKVKRQKSFWFLFNSSLNSFFAFLVLYGLFNWNGIIAKHNLSEVNYAKGNIDLEYNLSLGYEAYPYLLDYFMRHPQPNSVANKKFDYQMVRFKTHINSWTDFPSYRVSRYDTYLKIKDYQPLLNNDYEPYPY
ncbi:MAG: DUF4153 domain-containing protein [Putridiphycobacter sp.]